MAKNMRNLLHARMLRIGIISKLLKHRDYTCRELCEEVKTRLGLETLSPTTVAKDIKLLLAEWKAERLKNYDDYVRVELKRIDQLLDEAWEAWYKSKQDYEKSRARQVGVPNGDGEEGITTTHVEQMKENVNACGDPRYLELIHKFLVERRKLLGLYAPERKELTGACGKPLNQVPLIVEIIDRADQIRPKEE